ncbi:GNAT family N-acetyltransferase [Paenibacillus eucommiae]|uniref:RimJ/RimL family protein N-acetyltransferase n=1 Tax=Paenibacillus eucommiae TaxID=1355755 RepID=A0ABS4J3M6_9BACL|nr:GNAT family protein [Paenibacillus eucommiae]MBP1994445.1 RimJ/RimL family protein N-acetyltransferase [Paenibacillus eucommiae]
MPHLVGERIILREYRKEDLDSMRFWANDPVITSQLSDVFLYPHTRNSTEAYLNGILEGKSDQKGFVIANKETEAYIGQIDLFYIDWKNRSTEMGMVIGNPELQNKGYGTEAVLLLQKFVFQQLNLNRIQLEVYDYNANAIKCYLKCGFKEEGRLRQRHFANGRYSDVIMMGILRDDYEAIFSAVR